MNFISEDDVEGVTISIRDDPPSHYIFKIQSFSSLQKNSIERYDSGEFESESYKWKLSLYPNGSRQDTCVKDHISLYLVVADDTSSLPVNWEIIVTFKLFLLDQIHNKYLTIEDKGRFRRFHGEKTELGFSKLIPLATFNDPCNGYLLDDTCIFGVEVFVIKSTTKGERLSMIKEPSPFKHTWKIERFSELTEGYHESEAFNSTDHKWKVRLYPKGLKDKNHISLYLVMSESTTPNEKVYTRYSLSVRNQMGNQHVEEIDYNMFKELNTGWGRHKFIPLNDLYDEAKGFLVRDTCIVDAEVTVLGLATVFT